MTIVQILGLILSAILFSIFYVLLRSFLVWNMMQDMTEKEQEEYLKEIERQEAEQINKNKYL